MPPFIHANRPPATLEPVKPQRRPSPVVGLSALVLGVIAVGLLVLAISVVRVNAIQPSDTAGSVPSYAVSSGFVAGLALWLVIGFFFVIVINVVAAARRHFGH